MASSERNKNRLPKEEVKRILQQRKKESKRLQKEKRARLIVKNLPFKVTHDKLKEHFEQYGVVKSVELLKKNDGKLKGCGFVQFELVQKAAKAKHHTDGKEFMGRALSVDFAKSKKKYEEICKAKVKEEKTDENVEIKEECDVSVKDEPITDSTNEDQPDEEDSKSDNELEDESNDEDASDVEMDENIKEEHKPRMVSNDVTEGKTIFIKNVPFDATNDDLKKCMWQFGRVYYALICKDKLTEHPKGTAFVKFINKEDAESALNAGTELKLLGNILDCHPALDKNSVNKKANEAKDDKKQSKDSRNLYLVKEGVILAGNPASRGVSASDMAKRLQIEQYKTQMLRNLNMFVSKERLVVHNIPASWDDGKLRTLFQKYAGPRAVIREARVMRDMKSVDANGVGTSKEYGFVTFAKHEDALKALRSLNNNPGIFSEQKRPIITFSIENKAIVKAKQKRLDKSKRSNPTHKNFKPDNEPSVKNHKKIEKLTRKSLKQKKKSESIEQSEDLPKYSGVVTKPGVKEKMRSRYKLMTQAKLHQENLKKEKQKRKNAKKTLSEKRKEFTKQPKQKINRVVESDNFSKLVSNYKKKLVNVPEGKKSKWYD
ncbi:unnamed protein product [Phyllotreta striolata]|uniref:RRM domain-containing protein n=1 Tax=Phyllotreta striolata TaxID=444603 RepID=A0A9N9TJ55_PHYSR|nr:unnamed protein product [Phyllotreta striolata]